MHDLPAALDGQDRWLRLEPLHGDASSRRYSRLWSREGGTLILARYPAGIGNTLTRDLQVQRWLAERSLRVPRIVESDPEQGWVLLEDFGHNDAEQSIRATRPEARGELCACLIGPLAVLAGLPVGSLPAWNTPLDGRRLRWELAGFELWFVRHYRDRAPGPVIGRWLDGLAEELDSHPRRICHRDYHLNNLFALADGSVGVIDAQDLLVGPDTYDASSLLYERAFPELAGGKGQERWLAGWAEETGAAEGWRERSRLTRLQRSLKVLGSFARLHLAGRGQYGRWLEPLARDLAVAMTPLAVPSELHRLLLD